MTIYSRNDSKNLYYSFVIVGKIYSGSTRTSQRAKALKFERAKRVEIEGQLFHGESRPITLGDAVELFIKFKGINNNQ